jgi:hypothetical protein
MAMAMQQLHIRGAITSPEVAWDVVIHVPILFGHEVSSTPGAAPLLALQQSSHECTRKRVQLEALGPVQEIAIKR